MTQYRAITVWQPWASLIAIGAKRFEFRAHAPPASMWHTRIAIHAGRRRVDTNEVRALIDALNSTRAPYTGLDPRPAAKLLFDVLEHPGILPLSSVLCTVLMGKPVINGELAAALGVKFANDSDRDRHANYGWPLSEVRVLEPFQPARGRQGWWNWGGP